MKKSFVLLVFAFLGGWCFAQSAAHIEAILEMKTLSVGEACYLAACAGEKRRSTCLRTQKSLAIKRFRILSA